MRFVFIAIAVLNLLDGLFTYYGLTNHYITEANPVMESIWLISPFLFIAVKAFFSFLALFVGWKFHQKGIKASKLIKILWIAALILYIFVFCLHAVWIKLVIFT